MRRARSTVWFGSYREIGATSIMGEADGVIVHTEEARPAGFRWRSRTAAGPIPHGLLNDVIPVAVRAPQVLDGIRFLLFARLKPYRGSDLLIETFRLWPPDIGGRVEIWIVVKRQIAVGPLVTAVRDPGG